MAAGFAADHGPMPGSISLALAISTFASSSLPKARMARPRL
jgi:hypothetical protein